MPIQKARSRKLNRAYLILSNKNERFEDRLSLIDLFLPDTQMHFPNMESSMPGAAKEEYRAKLAQKLWEALYDAGFRLNHELEWQYQVQQECVWCGGQVITHGSEDSWETICTNCNYLYDED